MAKQKHQGPNDNEVSGNRQEVFRQVHSEQRQQILGIEHRRMVGRIVRLRCLPPYPHRKKGVPRP